MSPFSGVMLFTGSDLYGSGCRHSGSSEKAFLTVAKRFAKKQMYPNLK